MATEPAWEEVQLGDVVDLQTGYPFKSSHYTDTPSDPRLVGGDNIAQGTMRWDSVRRWPAAMTEDVAAYWLAAGDVLLAMDRPWIDAGLKRATIKESDLPALLVQRTARMRGTDRLHGAFLRYVIDSHSFSSYVLSVQTGTAIPHISPAQIKAFRFLLPPYDVQRAIVGVLGVIDDKIEVNRRMSETMEAMARALFKSWFVDFDPVHAKAAGRKPIGMDAATAALFPSEFVDTDLGPIPKGWTAAPLPAWAVLLSGGTPSKMEPGLWNGDVPWISPKVMTSLHADSPEAYVSESAVDNGTRAVAAGTTLLMVRGMGLHERVRVSQARVRLTFSQDVKALVPAAIESNLLFFAMLDAQSDLLTRVETSGHGTGKLPTELLTSRVLVMPPQPIQPLLARRLDELNDRIEVTRRERRALVALRDALLPKLVSGELSVETAG